MTRRIKGINKQALTEFENHYMSKLFQQQLSNQLGLAQHIRVKDSKITVSIREDLFESFVGALVEVSDMLQGEGYGYLNTYAFITMLFTNVNINPELAYGPPKTQVGQTFHRLGWGVPIEVISDTGSGIQVGIEMTSTALHYVHERGLNVPQVIGQAIAPTKKGASTQAYENALMNLNKYGVTRAWVLREREEKEFSNPDLAPYVEIARERLAREGYTQMSFFVPRYSITKETCVVQLLGTKPNGEQSQLASVSACDTNAGKRLALEQYATSSVVV